MDMHTVDTKLTGLTRAAVEHVPEQTNAKEQREAHSHEGAEASGTRGTDPKDHEDRVEISDVSKVLAALSEQQDESGDLQLPTDKLRRMIEG